MGICRRVATEMLAALLRLAAGLVLGATVGLVLVPLVAEAAADRLGQRSAGACCATGWEALVPAPVRASDGLDVVARLGQAVAIAESARTLLGDLVD